MEWWSGSWPRSFVDAFNPITSRGEKPQTRHFIVKLPIFHQESDGGVWNANDFEALQSRGCRITSLKQNWQNKAVNLHGKASVCTETPCSLKKSRIPTKNRSSSNSNYDTVRNHPLSNSLDRLWLTQMPAQHTGSNIYQKNHTKIWLSCSLKCETLPVSLQKYSMDLAVKSHGTVNILNGNLHFFVCYKNLHFINLILLVLTIHKHIPIL